MTPIKEQIYKLLEESLMFLKELGAHRDVPGSAYYQHMVERKIQQLKGLFYASCEVLDAATFTTIEEQLIELKLEMYAINKKWKLCRGLVNEIVGGGYSGRIY